MNKSLFQNAFLLSLFVTALHGETDGQVPDSVQRSVDSVKRILPTTTGVARYNLTFKIAYDLFDLDNTEAVKYAEEAFNLAKEVGDSVTIVRSGRIYGQLLWRVGELSKSIGVMENMISIAERHKLEKDLRFLANSLSIAYSNRGQYDKALENNFKSLERRQQNGNKLEIAIALNSIGSTFYSLGIYDRAAEFLKTSLATDSLNDFVPDLKVSLALCYERLNYLKEARSLIQTVLDQYGSRLTTHTTTRISFGLGLIDLRDGKLESARTLFQSGFELAAADSNKTYMSDCLAKLGELYLASGDFARAEKFLIESEFYSDEMGYRNGSEIANMSLAKLYTFKKDYIKASIAKSKIIALKDSSINQGVIENIYRHQFDFYQKQNRKIIASQAELVSLQQRSIKNHFILSIISWICAALSISVIVLLYRSNRLKKQIALDLEKRVHDRTHELRISVESLQHSHMERNFALDGIARRLNATIATFKGLGVVANTYEGIPTDFARSIDKVSDHLASILHQVTRSKK